MNKYTPDETMRWIWEVKEELSSELKDMSNDEIIAYFESKRSERLNVKTSDRSE